ncbi:competence type IV pilus minor pilin ComGG [Priestia taiwanensis]|uniref:Competence protein ComG n=1 Tax=Priestia taiwanensis TaxID=1347902 RepID=A0A917AVP6_9BACI|nr:competence type IV pilus minor pilin ComGG [Priestia taiwanensis]MBM7363815.1 hypothetical protein [Priestia taiwanensis]GGE73896.1 hypothetical protein GCM10007140_24710 [Priestia taiwanensis]
MIRSERGFILPMTVISVTIFMLFVIHQANMYITEKRFYKESEEIVELDYLMQQAVSDAKQLLQVEQNSAKVEYTKEFQEGTAHIQAELIETSFRVRVECRTINERKYIVRYIYDPEADKITNWRE